MAAERASTALWLPITFVLEVAAWEIGSRLELAIVDPTWEEFGRSIGVERITWGLGGTCVVLFALFILVSRRRSTLQVSMVQLPGVLAMGCYWIGASVLASGAVVVGSALAAWVLGTRSARP